MLRLATWLVVLAAVEVRAQSRIVEITFPGSFDELVSKDGEYRVEGRASPDDMYGFEASLFTDERCIYASAACKRTNVKTLYVENQSEGRIRIKSIPLGVQTVTFRGEVDLMPCQTNISVTCLGVERDIPSGTNVIKDIVSSFPNLEVLTIMLSGNGTTNVSFDASECLGSRKLRFLHLISSPPIKNIKSLDCLKDMGAILKYEKL